MSPPLPLPLRAALLLFWSIAPLLLCWGEAAAQRSPGPAPEPLGEEEAPQPEGPALKARPLDDGYDSAQSVKLRAPLPGAALKGARVDRREEVDALAAQGVLFPTTYLPKSRRVVYRNQLLFGQQLGLRLNDRVMLNAMAVLSPGNVGWNAGGDFDRRLGLGARFLLFERDDLRVALEPGVHHQKGLYRLDTSAWNAQMSAVVENKASDTLIFSGGVMLNVPLSLGYTALDDASCSTRQEYVEGSCLKEERFSEPLPPGGQFLLGWAGASLYATEHVHFKGELFTAVRRGTILGLEGALYNDQDLETELERYRTRSFSFGPVQGAPLGAALSVGFSWPHVGTQLGLMVLPGASPPVDNRGDQGLGFGELPQIFPTWSTSVTF